MAGASDPAAATIGRGLEGIVVAETALSMVDGTNGRLAYRGYSIDDLAQHASFEEVLYLLWYGALPTAGELATLERKLAAARRLSPRVMGVMRALPTGGAPIDALRAGVTALALEDPDCDNLHAEALQEKSIHMAGALPTMLAAYLRLRGGQEPVDPAPDLGHAANFLWMLDGAVPSELRAQAMNAYLVLVCEHSMNASTFSARVTASTLSDIYSSMSTGLGTLKGDAHGGANMRAMEMLIAIGSPEEADEYIEESLRIKRRLMGMGHRIYKTRDPRVNHLMGYSARLAEETGVTTWHRLAEKMEEITSHHPYFVERRLFPNVEFYSAPMLYTLGIPLDAMPAAFGLSRIGGWTANVMDQYAVNRIYRPQARYVGPEHQDWVPIEQRG